MVRSYILCIAVVLNGLIACAAEQKTASQRAIERAIAGLEADCAKIDDALERSRIDDLIQTMEDMLAPQQPKPAGVPGHAVLRGPFIAWREPAIPGENAAYQIVILVRIGDTSKKYRPSDLSGTILSVQKYKQNISFPTNDTADIQDGFARVSVTMPGAVEKAADVVTITSRKLHVSRTIKLD